MGDSIYRLGRGHTNLGLSNLNGIGSISKSGSTFVGLQNLRGKVNLNFGGSTFIGLQNLRGSTHLGEKPALVNLK